MAAGRRGKGDGGRGRVSCSCGKYGHTKRAGAKEAARIYHPGARLSVYQCAQSGLWHYGHLPNAVRAGDFDRETFRQMRGQA